MRNIYESKHYKWLLILPLILLPGIIYFSTQVKSGIDFKGGILITAPLNKTIDADTFGAQLLSKYELEDLNVRITGGAASGIFIEFTGERTLLDAQAALEQKDYNQTITLSKKYSGTLNITGDEATQADAYYSKARESFKNNITSFAASFTGTAVGDFSLRDIGPSLGSLFLGQARNALIAAFALIAMLIFYYFRNPVISFAVVQSAAYDAFLGYAALGLFGIPLSLATIAPILMLIGYSVDTDIMLTDRILRRKEGTPQTRTAGAIKTGFTMVGTALASLVALFIVASYANIEVLHNISLVLIVGLVGDLVATWCTNAVMVLWYVERKAIHKIVK